jgi:hypothetical protein
MTLKTAHGFDKFDLFLFRRCFPVMRQQFRQLPEWMRIDSGEYVFQIFVWIDAIALQVAMRLIKMAAVSPPRLLPTKRKLRLPIQTGQIARSATYPNIRIFCRA